MFGQLLNLLKKGEVIKNTYELISELGVGCVSIVWEAFDKNRQIPVAIKFLPEHLLFYPEEIFKIRKKVLSTLTLSHPNIVKVYAYDEFEGVPFVVMEKVGKGETLDQLIRQKGKFSLDEVLNLLRPLADALQYAQSSGVLHEDLRPQNILLDQDETPKIEGFGYYKITKEIITKISKGSFQDLSYYQAPECFKDSKEDNITSALDVYSLGMIVYEMLSGIQPYKGLDPVQLYYAISNKEVMDIDGAGEMVNEVIKIALSKDPKDRYKSVREFYKAFEIAVKRKNYEKPQPGKVWKDPYLGMEFVYVPGGIFDMGDVFGDGEEDEVPVHRVELDGFWMGKYPVTVGQWKRFVEESGYEWDMWSEVKKYSPSEKHPIIFVSWEDAKEFARWLSEKTGYKFRLPTEAQWEYTARSCGKKVKYGTSTGEISYDLANYNFKYQSTTPVGSFPPNSLGLYDLSGNVWEWCEDVYADDAYKHHVFRNPVYREFNTNFVVRGGCWKSKDKYLRCFYRNHCPDFKNCNNVGFRLVLRTTTLRSN